MTSWRRGRTCPTTPPPQRSTSPSTGTPESRSSSPSPTTTSANARARIPQRSASGLSSDSVFPGFAAQGPNQHNQQRILDVDGTRLVITAYDVPSTSPQDRADLDEALASIQIG